MIQLHLLFKIKFATPFIPLRCVRGRRSSEEEMGEVEEMEEGLAPPPGTLTSAEVIIFRYTVNGTWRWRRVWPRPLAPSPQLRPSFSGIQ
jgi:hypothetical protein